MMRQFFYEEYPLNHLDHELSQACACIHERDHAGWWSWYFRSGDLQGGYNQYAPRQLADSLLLPDFAANMAMEYRIASRILIRDDFVEGVRAVLVDKDNAPQWQPATPDQMTPTLIDAIFAPLPDNTG